MGPAAPLGATDMALSLTVAVAGTQVPPGGSLIIDVVVRTWSNANVFLRNLGDAHGVVPAGPNWDIEPFRERGVPRNFALGFIDPFTGTVKGLDFCAAPCDR